MSRKTIEDLLITLSYLKIVIIFTTITVMILIIIDGSNTETLLSHYKVAFLAINFKALTANSPIIIFLNFLWRYFFEFILSCLGLISLLRRQFILYFLALIVAMAFSFSIRVEIVIIIGLEIALQMMYLVKCKYQQD